MFTGEAFCESCGRALGDSAATGDPTRPDHDDHIEIETRLAGGVTDRGRRHRHNEDAMALCVLDGGEVAAVVCDGVSTSVRPDEASRSAADTGVAVLAARLAAGDGPQTATRTALLRAAEAVAALGRADAGTPADETVAANAPACTYVSALVTPPESGTGVGTVTVGWVGDSRAYWLADGGGRRLTVDDSLAADMAASGALTEAEALAHPHAHVLTGWLGADAGHAEPHVATFAPDGPGTLLICTDGLWNYLPEPTDIASAMPDADPLTAAQALVRLALEAGGRDNITVVVIPTPLDRPENAE